MTDEPQPNGDTPPARKEVPQYRLTGPVYVNETLYDQGQIDRMEPQGGILIYFKGVPNVNMQPVNAAAKAMAKAHPLPEMNSIEALTKVVPTGTPGQ